MTTTPNTPLPVEQSDRTLAHLIAVEWDAGRYEEAANILARHRHRLQPPPAVAQAGEVKRDDDCPHCGASGYPDIEHQKGSDKVHPYRVVCKKCGCGTAWHGDWEAARKSWSRRATLQPTGGDAEGEE